MISVDDAVRRILDATSMLGRENVDLDDCRGRYLADDVVAVRALPPADNSAMDGFAVRAADLPGRLPIAGDVPAGAAPGELPTGVTLRIMTGAPVPAGADTVVMRENVTEDDGVAVFDSAQVVGRHIRRRGEDVEVGAKILAKGMRVGAGEIGALAGQGMAQVGVGLLPELTIVSTGDELVDVDTDPGPGQIVNSNAHALTAQAREAGAVVRDRLTVRDDLAATTHVIEQGLSGDALITCGGVSVGDRDFVKPALKAAGVELVFWKVAMKPGKPVVFGRAPSGCLFFGLPGNPVSAMVGFELFVRPALLAMQGADPCERPVARAVLDSDYTKSPGRTHFIRARAHYQDGRLHVEPRTKQGSGMQSAMVDLDALAIIPAATTSVERGALVDVILLRAVGA